jgi:hypothetical protein
MDENQRALIEQACLRLLAQYTVATDSNDRDLWLDVFSDDAIWEAPSLRLAGREEFDRFFGNRSNGKTTLAKHISANEFVQVIDLNTATAVSSMLVFRQGDYPGSGIGKLLGPSAIIDNADSFVRVDSKWKIKHRVTTVKFAPPQP